ncbi:MAG: ABC transporter permease subunit [Pseudonocardia sp.]|nr:ABC transporter permease subunit [Pseudonocardia sp.]
MSAADVLKRDGLLARIGPAHRWRAVLRSEVRKTTSVRLYWLLLIPIAVLALAMSLFGSLITLLVPGATDTSPVLLLAGLASTLSAVSMVGGAFGALSASGEYRHRTVTQAFLTGSRGQVLGSKVVVAAVVAAVYGLLMALLGPLLGGAVLGGQTLPGAGALISLGLVGMLVCAFWGVIGVAVGTLVPNQAGAVALVVGYSLIGENVLAGVLRAGEDGGSSPTVFARVTSFLPGNAGDIALYESPVNAAGQGGDGRQILEFLAGVSSPPPGWLALLVLLAWTVAAVALATVVGGRRDIT